jgi:hypothetical protein
LKWKFVAVVVAEGVEDEELLVTTSTAAAADPAAHALITA